MFYFDHDTSASKDSRILMLRKQHGGAAVDAYWSIIEILYTEEKPLGFSDENPEVFALSMWLCCDYSDLEIWIHAMLKIGLLINASDDDSEILLWSERVGERVSEYQEKQETARQNGKKGGRPKKQETEQKPSENQTETQKNPGVSICLTNKNKNKNKNRIEEKEINKEKSARFVPPTPDEVTEYSTSRGHPIEGNAFCDYYTARGWQYNRGQPMKDWRAAVRTWIQRDHQTKQQGGEYDADLEQYIAALSSAAS